MSVVPIVCEGPGPHDPENGVIGTIDEEEFENIIGKPTCGSPYCLQAIADNPPQVEVNGEIIELPPTVAPTPDHFTQFDNRRTLRQQARTALENNRALITNEQIDAYLNAAAPTNADSVKAIKLLLREARDAARQRNGIIRLLLNELDGTN